MLSASSLINLAKRRPVGSGLDIRLVSWLEARLANDFELLRL